MTIQVRTDGQVAILTILRPEVYNCLNFQTLQELRGNIEDLRTNSQVRAVIITGAGEKAFCTGADLKERRNMSPAQVQEYLLMIRDTFTAIEKLPKPVIAAINGLALGGGAELALSCDLRFMTDNAQLGLTETSLGIIPGAGGTQRLPRLVGKGKAKELIFTAKRIIAKEALEIGLVNGVVEDSDLLDVAKQLAEKIAANAPLALAQAKFAIDVGAEVDLATGLAIELNAYQALIPTRDRLEGLQAFSEKRTPKFMGE